MPGFSPDRKLRWPRLKPGILHPRYQLTHDMAETRAIFFTGSHGTQEKRLMSAYHNGFARLPSHAPITGL